MLTLECNNEFIENVRIEVVQGNLTITQIDEFGNENVIDFPVEQVTEFTKLVAAAKHGARTWRDVRSMLIKGEL